MQLISLPSGSTKLADARDLDLLCQQGWKIVATFQDQVVESLIDELPPVGPANGSGYNSYGQPKQYVTRQHLAQRTRFVLLKDRDTVIEGLQEQLNNAQHEARTARADYDSAFKAKQRIEEELAAAKTVAAQAESRRKQLLEEAEAMSVTKRKLEADIAKIRSAVGALKMKEILG